MAQLQSPNHEFKLVITVIREEMTSQLDLPRHARMTSLPKPSRELWRKYNSVLNLRELLQILIMPKITYPRPCPKCGKELSRGQFFRHKKHGGKTNHRVQCPLCSLTFSLNANIQRHVQQQHLNNLLLFACTICYQGFTRAQTLKLHV